MSDCSLYIATFIVTALWDIVLRYMCENYSALPEVIKNTLPFIKDLIPYFKAHTVLAAALIAGFIGATTQMIIINIASYPNMMVSDVYSLVVFLTVSFIVSALYGFVMKFSGLFPILVRTYYDKLETGSLGVIRSMYHDGISGLIVQCTLLTISYISYKMNLKLV